MQEWGGAGLEKVRRIWAFFFFLGLRVLERGLVGGSRIKILRVTDRYRKEGSEEWESR